MEEFRVRPGYGTPSLMLIEFHGDHRAEGFPPVLRLLEGQLSEFSCTASWPAPDDFLWECVYAGGTFELSDDWGGLFILPTSNNGQVVADVSSALEASGQFRRAAEPA
jgi:hypothetical protein